MTTSGEVQELKPHGPVMRARGGKLRFSCQCRASMTKHTRDKGGGEYYEPMEVKPGETVWDAYNNPENHYIEFTESDRIRA